MKNLSKEIENYLRVCADSKGLSPLTLKAYETDFRQFICFMHNKERKADGVARSPRPTRPLRFGRGDDKKISLS